jgi:carboxymethylenebutenolidase
MTRLEAATFGRRALVAGIAGVPLAAVLADPRLTAMAAEATETISIPAAGGRKVGAALAVPAATPAPTVLLIHEWWGLNDEIKAMAAEFAKEGFLALAIDLYDGKVASDPAVAEAYMNAVDSAQATEALTAAIAWLRAEARGNGKVGTVGWCFGGGWSLNASIAAPVDATVIYYGRVERSADDLRKLSGPVLGHFADRDQWINKPMVDGFAANLKQASRPAELHWYEADHAFANPTGQNYDKEDAQLAWSRTLEFFRANLG